MCLVNMYDITLYIRSIAKFLKFVSTMNGVYVYAVFGIRIINQWTNFSYQYIYS